MSVSLDIAPLHPAVHLYGNPDTSSAYALSGHITLSLLPAFSLFESRKTTNLLLQSLELTFEGQSEIVAPNIGYSALRLCSITRQLAPSVGLEISNEGNEYSREPCRWQFVFNIPIPGWLPATSTFGFDEVGNSYSLYATAKFVNTDAENPQATWFDTLCTPFRSKQWDVTTNKPIQLTRFVELPTSSLSPVPTSTYFVRPKSAVPITNPEHPRIPDEVLDKIHILTSVPEYVDMEDTEPIPVTLRLRTKGLEAEHCRKLRMRGFQIKLVQKDKCRSAPTPEYKSKYPLPPEAEQPPNVPLRTMHQFCSLFDRYAFMGSSDGTCSRTFSLLPNGESGTFSISSDNYIFANDADEGRAPTWYSLQAKIPHAKCGPMSHCIDLEWAGVPVLRPSVMGPLLEVRHELRLSILLAYDLGGEERRAKDVLEFCIPIKFAKVAPPVPSLSVPASRVASSTRVNSQASEIATPFVPQSLPPYSQLYHSNGDRKPDPMPPPMYTSKDDEPVPSTSSSPSSSSSVLPDSKEPVPEVDDDLPETARLLP